MIEGVLCAFGAGEWGVLSICVWACLRMRCVYSWVVGGGVRVCVCMYDYAYVYALRVCA